MDRKIKKVGDKFEIVETGTASLSEEDLKGFRMKLIMQKKGIVARLKELDDEIAGVNEALGLAKGDES